MQRELSLVRLALQSDQAIAEASAPEALGNKTVEDQRSAADLVEPFQLLQHLEQGTDTLKACEHLVVVPAWDVVLPPPLVEAAAR